MSKNHVPLHVCMPIYGMDWKTLFVHGQITYGYIWVYRGVHGHVWVYTVYYRGVHEYIMGIHGSISAYKGIQVCMNICLNTQKKRTMFVLSPERNMC